MKKIDYSKRSLFEEFMSEDTDFIINLIQKYEMQSILEIPCANGRNLSIIGSRVESAYFGDINPQMVEAVQKKIMAGNWSNCQALILDLCDLSGFPFVIDAVLIMQQSFQMLSLESGKMALQNLRKANCHYIIIDIYDFKSNAWDIPQFLVRNSTFVDCEEKKWIRSSSISDVDSNWIHITHKYNSIDGLYFAEVNLLNYTREQLILLCEECGYCIYDYYTDYSFGKESNLGRTIIILENKSAGGRIWN